MHNKHQDLPSKRKRKVTVLPQTSLSRFLKFISALLYLCAIAPLVVFIKSSHIGIPLALLVGLGARILAKHSRRLEATTSKIEWQDAEADVLLLRAFSDDNLRTNSLRDPSSWLELLNPEKDWFSTFENCIVEKLPPSSMGRLITLARPNETLAPDGFLRVTAEDDEWQRAVDKFSKTAAVTLIIYRATRNLQWEISHLMSSNILHKTVILVPHGKVNEQNERWGSLIKALHDHRVDLHDALVNIDGNRTISMDSFLDASPVIAWELWSTTGSFHLSNPQSRLGAILASNNFVAVSFNSEPVFWMGKSGSTVDSYDPVLNYVAHEYLSSLHITHDC